MIYFIYVSITYSRPMIYPSTLIILKDDLFIEFDLNILPRKCFLDKICRGGEEKTTWDGAFRRYWNNIGWVKVCNNKWSVMERQVRLWWHLVLRTNYKHFLTTSQNMYDSAKDKKSGQLLWASLQLESYLAIGSNLLSKTSGIIYKSS